jgi:tRNA(fMet)-specific endonuclease VapC
VIVLDTDITSLLFSGHERVVARYQAETDEVVITTVTRIEMLEGRFATLLKAADGAELVRAQNRLQRAESDLAAFRILPVDAAVAVEFDRLRQDKKLKKIGRKDLLIGCIALSQGAILGTRNTKDFRQIKGLKVENWAD